MAFKNFRVKVSIRVALLAISIYIFLYLLTRTTLYASILFIGGISVFQVYGLVHCVEKSNRDLIRFFQSIKHSDFSEVFSNSIRGKSFEELNTAFNEAIKVFQRERAEKAEHFRYLQTIVQHVGIGLIAFKQNGEVDLINNAAKRLLKLSRLRNIDQLETVSKDFVAKLKSLKHGDKNLVKYQENDEFMQLAIYATDFIMRQQRYKLVSIQNIQSELEEKEMEAWQKLIRVLTHEIMNSVTPILSLASTVNTILDKHFEHEKCDMESNREAIKDFRYAVRTIEKRSRGLLSFVDNYRKLTRVPEPDYQIFSIADLFERICHLMRIQLDEFKIVVNFEVEPRGLELTADPDLIEQVMINLMKNAIEAVSQIAQPTIKLAAFMDGRDRTIIQVSDNGEGIQKKVLEKMFIPFFTTKSYGSGIGLSLSRQIMQLHRGTISVNSIPDVGTILTLRF